MARSGLARSMGMSPLPQADHVWNPEKKAPLCSELSVEVIIFITTKLGIEHDLWAFSVQL